MQSNKDTINAFNFIKENMSFVWAADLASKKKLNNSTMKRILDMVMSPHLYAKYDITKQDGWADIEGVRNFNIKKVNIKNLIKMLNEDDIFDGLKTIISDPKLTRITNYKIQHEFNLKQ